MRIFRRVERTYSVLDRISLHFLLPNSYLAFTISEEFPRTQRKLLKLTECLRHAHKSAVSQNVRHARVSRHGHRLRSYLCYVLCCRRRLENVAILIVFSFFLGLPNFLLALLNYPGGGNWPFLMSRTSSRFRK